MKMAIGFYSLGIGFLREKALIKVVFKLFLREIQLFEDFGAVFRQNFLDYLLFL